MGKVRTAEQERRRRDRRRAEDPVGYAKKMRERTASYRLLNPEKAKAARDRSNAKWNPILRARAKAVREAYRIEHAEEIEAAKRLRSAAAKDRARAAKKAYRKANPEKRRIEKRESDRRLTARRRYAWLIWVMTHWTEAKAYCDEINSRFNERRRLNRINRKALERKVGGWLSKGLFSRLFAVQKGKCAICRVKTPKGMHLDHIIPLAGGGPNEDTNIQLLCPLCNFSKGAKNPVEFMQSRGFLI